MTGLADTTIAAADPGGLRALVAAASAFRHHPGVDGFLIQSIEEGCEAVERVGALDRAECRRRAVDHFSADAVVARYIDLYSKVRARLARP
jgi:glycosyltransferase involved in cell wall biosynthesis